MGSTIIAQSHAIEAYHHVQEASVGSWNVEELFIPPDNIDSFGINIMRRSVLSTLSIYHSVCEVFPLCRKSGAFSDTRAPSPSL